MDYTSIVVDQVMLGAEISGLRTGQWLFNHLPAEVANKVAGTIFDPFYKEMSIDEVFEWIDNHLIFQGNQIVALFDNNTILWEQEHLD